MNQQAIGRSPASGWTTPPGRLLGACIAVPFAAHPAISPATRAHAVHDLRDYTSYLGRYTSSVQGSWPPARTHNSRSVVPSACGGKNLHAAKVMLQSTPKSSHPGCLISSRGGKILRGETSTASRERSAGRFGSLLSELMSSRPRTDGQPTSRSRLENDFEVRGSGTRSTTPAYAPVCCVGRNALAAS